MKVLLLGKTGLIGSALFSEFEKSSDDFIVVAPSHIECDVTRTKELLQYVRGHMPDVIINATGYTAVDKAEEEPDMAQKLNAEAVRGLAKIAAGLDIPLVHFSTDYVFDGSRKQGYSESDSPAPISVYGSSKAAGEKALTENLKKYYLVRTAWVYGSGGKNFVDTILERARTGEPLRVVGDQFGSPTYSVDLAQAVLRLLQGQKYGIYHLVNSGETSWYEFAVEIFHQLGIPQKIIPITSEQLNRPAKRPQYSLLKNTKLPPLRHWKEALSEYLMQKTLIV